MPRKNEQNQSDPGPVAKAARLRQQIAALESNQTPATPPAAGAATPPTPAPRSPREFIQKRMAELGGPPRPGAKPAVKPKPKGKK
jgi:hypothetical protein